jgi:AcrR family transcriptional regulator
VPRQLGHIQDNCPADAGSGPGAWAETVAAHKDRTRARILDAAVALIGERGAGGLAMTTLARRAGVARATLYNYFPDAERLLEALVEAEVAVFLDDLDRRLASVAGPAGQLDATVGELVAWVARQAGRRPARAAGPVTRGGARSVDMAGIHRPLAAIEDRTSQVIAAARDAGVVPPHTDPVLAARFTVALAFGIRGQLAGRGRDRTAAALRTFLLAGLGYGPPS